MRARALADTPGAHSSQRALPDAWRRLCARTLERIIPCTDRCSIRGRRDISGVWVGKKTVIWRKTPAAQDFSAAQSYLALICPAARVPGYVRRLRRAGPATHAAKDLLRASGLPLLPRKESHVAADLKRIHKGKALSPVLLLRGSLSRGLPLIVADGYHRICASCHFDENAGIVCRIIDP
jgi:hypothetical protein